MFRGKINFRKIGISLLALLGLAGLFGCGDNNNGDEPIDTHHEHICLYGAPPYTEEYIRIEVYAKKDDNLLTPIPDLKVSVKDLTTDLDDSFTSYTNYKGYTCQTIATTSDFDNKYNELYDVPEEEFSELLNNRQIVIEDVDGEENGEFEPLTV